MGGVEKREGGRKGERNSRGKVGKEGQRKDMKRKKKKVDPGVRACSVTSDSL